MIEDKELTLIGEVGKTHGVKGDLNIRFDVEVELDELKCIFFKIDNINVPFFIDDFRFRSSDTAIVHINGIESEPEARKFFGYKVYALTQELDIEDDISLAALIGCELRDANGTKVGIIDDYDDSTINILLHLENDALIPLQALEDVDIDLVNKIITAKIPEGLV